MANTSGKDTQKVGATIDDKVEATKLPRAVELGAIGLMGLFYGARAIFGAPTAWRSMSEYFDDWMYGYTPSDSNKPTKGENIAFHAGEIAGMLIGAGTILAGVNEADQGSYWILGALGVTNTASLGYEAWKYIDDNKWLWDLKRRERKEREKEAASRSYGGPSTG